ncbi:hypothetical protein PILCRDRAFT_83514 [Piloderma croceum F 1598]|uniref:Uncharacterized protein n=1 Tax=Piloderma croceum (strain F 1598) TaxID=765440 RepID=A0A0C3CRL7_PILCF|nr:hypothetical protein PILCRDRAFT_83514 [Piloderma croceum F 1598]
MADCCDFFSICCCSGWCFSRKKDYANDLEDHDAFHAQFESQYDPHRNLVYNVDRDAEPPIVTDHRRIISQPMGQEAMMSPPDIDRPLGGDAPFGPRPTPDQLPPYSSRATSPQPQLVYPPATFQPGGIKSTESRAVQSSGGGRVSDGSSSDGMKASAVEEGAALEKARRGDHIIAIDIYFIKFN